MKPDATHLHWTPSQIATEKAYRRDERLGLLCGSDEPTPSQVNQAELEADLWESRLLLKRILNGQEAAV
jgi:hypothetical protein